MTTSKLNRAETAAIGRIVDEAIAVESRERGCEVGRHDKCVLDRVCAEVAQKGAQMRKDVEEKETEDAI